MKAQQRSSASQELQLSELEAVSGGGFWKDVGRGVGASVRHVEEFFEQGVEGIYNIGTTGSP